MSTWTAAWKVTKPISDLEGSDSTTPAALCCPPGEDLWLQSGQFHQHRVVLYTHIVGILCPCSPRTQEAEAGASLEPCSWMSREPLAQV